MSSSGLTSSLSVPIRDDLPGVGRGVNVLGSRSVLILGPSGTSAKYALSSAVVNHVLGGALALAERCLLWEDKTSLISSIGAESCLGVPVKGGNPCLARL